jgi:hypothetical protein
MTMSEFDTLRADLAAIRSDLETRIGGLREDVDRLRADMDGRLTGMDGRLTGLRTEMDLRFARIEAKIDEKPGAGVIYQASLAMMTGMFAVMIGTVLLLKTLAYIP